MNRVTWGIYPGFNKRRGPWENWTPPLCAMCSRVLLPWVDWVGHGCIGYCEDCRELLLVWSDWEPHPDYHPKEEKSRLIAHHSRPTGLRSQGFEKDQLLWEWHEAIPSSKETIHRANELRLAQSGQSDELIVLEHLLWTIIWNTECRIPELLEEYLWFVYHHPHFVELDGRSVFMGYETYLVSELERKYGEEVLRTVHSIYLDTDLPPLEFRMRLGFYLPASEEAYEDYEPEFVEYAMKAKRRLW